MFAGTGNTGNISSSPVQTLPLSPSVDTVFKQLKKPKKDHLQLNPDSTTSLHGSELLPSITSTEAC